MKKFCIVLIFSFISMTFAFGNVSLPRLFSDNMVLQRNKSVPVWGWADPGEQIKVSLGTQHAETVTDATGTWKIVLGPLDAGGPFELILTGKNTISVKNLLKKAQNQD